MKIAVCVKQVPDSWVEKKMDGQVLDRLGVDAVLNDLDEYALEEALRIVEANSPTGAAGPESGHEITLLCMGPERATEALRKGLSMGADSALLISDLALAGSDALSTSLVLAQVIASGGFDLVMCGTESTDARMSVIPAMLAERLGWAQLTHVHKLDIVRTFWRLDSIRFNPHWKIVSSTPRIPFGQRELMTTLIVAHNTEKVLWSDSNWIAKD